MEVILNESSPWKWRVRDCAWYPDFLQCNPEDGMRICIYKEGSVYRCLVESRIKSDVELFTFDSVLIGSLTRLSCKESNPKGLLLEKIESFEWPFD
jgi:hypothetical protein